MHKTVEFDFCLTWLRSVAGLLIFYEIYFTMVIKDASIHPQCVVAKALRTLGSCRISHAPRF